MASIAKYTPAALRDPDEVASYSQAPPSYQADTSAAVDDDQARLFGGVPRGSDDGDGDIPDDFKFGGSVAEATVDIRNQFVRKVYTILTVQLLVTAGISALSFFSEGYKTWIQSNPSLVWISVKFLSFPPHASIVVNTNKGHISSSAQWASCS
jgi:hypothetical protein